MKKKTFKRAGAAVLSMAMLLSFGAISATTSYAADTKYKIAVTDTQDTGVAYKYLKIADATENNGRYEYGAVQDPFKSVLKTDTASKNIVLKTDMTLGGTAYAAGTEVGSIATHSAAAKDLADALISAAGTTTFTDIPTDGLTAGYYLLKDTETTSGGLPILISLTNSDQTVEAKATKLPFSKTIEHITSVATSGTDDNDVISTDKKTGVAEANATVTYQLATQFPKYDETNVIARTLYAKDDGRGNWDGTTTTEDPAEAVKNEGSPVVIKYATDITDFTITDISEDTITIDKDTIKVYLGSVATANLVAATNYSVTSVTNGKRTVEDDKTLFTTSTTETAGTSGFKIVFNDDYVIDNRGTNVYVVFDAKVVADPDVQTDKNANEATLDYNNNYFTGGSIKNDDGTYKTPDNPNKEEHDEADVYATLVNVNKLQPDGAGTKALTGAQFNLYKKDDGNKKLVGTYTVTDDYMFKFSGLGKGTYVIEETTVPTGFAKAADIEFTVTPTVETNKYLGNFTYSNTQDAGTTNTLDVINYPGSTLPGTGGMGTILFTVGGAAIVLLAGTMFVIYMKKRKVEE